MSGSASFSTPWIHVSGCLYSWSVFSTPADSWWGGQLSHSISFSRAAAMASTLWWAPVTLARLLSTEDSLLPLSGVQYLGGQTSFGWDLAAVSDVLLCFYPWQSSKEDTTSSISSGSPGGDPGSLCCLYTSRYKDCISFLLV